MDKKYRLIYDENLCIGCQACNVACRVENGVPEHFFRLQVRVETQGSFPDLRMCFSRVACVMCEHAPCVDVCPTHASFQTKDGLVHIDARTCISCKYCILACPYEARFVNPITKAVDKCDFCFGSRVSKALNPACVSVCPTEALSFGDMRDKKSAVWLKSAQSSLLFPKAYLRTSPKVAFIPHKRGEAHE